MTSPSSQPLAGLNVLELGQLIAGPFAGRMLADFGAQVIKLEQPEAGDPLRNWRTLHNGTSLWWYVQGRNKKSVGVDLRKPEGQAIARELVRRSDVMIENFRPGTLEKWGLDYATLSADNPGLILLRLSGFGQSGPMREQAGFGAIGESMGGMRHITGFPDRPPVRINISIGDSLASLHGVIGVLMALNHRAKTGKGQVVDVALYEAVFNMMESMLPEYDLFGIVRERTGSNLTGIVPSNTYPTRDGKHIVIGANADSIFKRLCAVMGRDDWANDAELANNEGRAKRRDELDGGIGAWTAGHDMDALLDKLSAAQVPASKIYSIADIASDAQYLQREMLLQTRLPDGTPLKVPGIVPKLSDTPGAMQWVGPRLGEHTDEVLTSLGFEPARIAALRTAGVVK